MDPEVYEQNTDSWGTMVSADFPVHAPLSHAHINLDNMEVMNAPIIPRFQIYHRYWEREIGAFPNSCIQSRRDGFFFNHCSNPKNLGEYSRVKSQFFKWSPPWVEQFGVNQVESAILHYVNVIGKDTTPAYVGETGNVRIGEVIKVFSNFGDTFPKLVPPYHCEVNFEISKDPAINLKLVVAGLKEKRDGASGVKVEFIAQQKLDGTLNDWGVFSNVFDGLHGVILKQFSHVFTEGAIKSFR